MNDPQIKIEHLDRMSVEGETGARRVMFGPSVSLDDMRRLIEILRQANAVIKLHDFLYPSPSDPGAYMTYSQERTTLGRWSMSLGNHGWSDGVYQIDGGTIALQVFSLYAQKKLPHLTFERGRIFQRADKSELENLIMAKKIHQLHSQFADVDKQRNDSVKSPLPESDLLNTNDDSQPNHLLLGTAVSTHHPIPPSHPRVSGAILIMGAMASLLLGLAMLCGGIFALFLLIMEAIIEGDFHAGNLVGIFLGISLGIYFLRLFVRDQIRYEQQEGRIIHLHENGLRLQIENEEDIVILWPEIEKFWSRTFERRLQNYLIDTFEILTIELKDQRRFVFDEFMENTRALIAFVSARVTPLQLARVQQELQKGRPFYFDKIKIVSEGIIDHADLIRWAHIQKVVPTQFGLQIWGHSRLGSGKRRVLIFVPQVANIHVLQALIEQKVAENGAVPEIYGRSFSSILRKYRIAFIVLAAFAIGAVYIGTQNRAADVHYEAAIAAFEEGDCQRVADQFAQGEERDDRSFFIRKANNRFKYQANDRLSLCENFLRGVHAQQARDYVQALLQYEQTLTYSTNTIYLNGAEKSAAITIMDGLIQEQLAIMYDGLDYQQLADPALCCKIDTFQQHNLIPESDNKVPVLYMSCGDLYVQNNRYQQAIEMYQHITTHYNSHERAPEAEEKLAQARLVNGTPNAYPAYPTPAPNAYPSD